MAEDEMVGWHHQCNGHELGQTPGDGEGQGGLACCKKSDTTGRLNNLASAYLSNLTVASVPCSPHASNTKMLNGQCSFSSSTNY